MAWVVEITGYDIGAAADKTLRFAMGSGVAFTDAPYAHGALVRWNSVSQKIDIDQNGQVASGGDGGELAIVNQPDDITLAGQWDALAGWAWQNRTAMFYWVPGTLWAEKVLVARALLEQPVAPLAVTSGSESTLRFTLKDFRAALETPLQPVKYLGDNVPPDGVGGAADIKGKPIPILYGVASNIPGTRVNEPKLIWQLCDKLATVLCVRDGAIPLTAGVARANVASLLANTPVSGTYDYCAIASGTYVRLGSTPIKRLTFDAQEGATAADRTHAQIWKRIRMERCGTVIGDIAAASVTATDTAAPKEVGFWWDGEISRKAALDEVLASLSGYEVFDTAGDWNIAPLLAPSGTPAIRLVLLTQTTALKATDRPLIDITRVRPNFAPNGAPPYRVNVRWGRNYTVMSAADFLGAAAQRLRDKFAQEWRTETATNAAIWDPVAGTGAFPNAPELTIETGYQPGDDNLTCPHAQTEAAARLALYSTLKAQYQVGYTPAVGDILLPGQVVGMVFPAYLDTGPLFRVLQSQLTVENNRAKAALVVGLQT